MLELAETLARQAGEILLDRLQRRGGRGLRIARKGPIDLVTDADLASQEHIRRGIRARFPDHDLLLEEGHGTDRGAPYRWIVDPLDGTTNYVHAHPMFAVSLALEHRGSLVLGVVHAPVAGETYTSLRGEGAWLNGTRIHVSTTPTLSESLVATGFPYARAEIPDNNVENFTRVVLAVRGIRRGGSAALDLAYVAAGRLDAFWELHLAPWDTAAGACLVREAGGRVTDLGGGDGWLLGRSILASNGLVHDPLRARLSPPRPR